jgi:hypothetical protein
MRSFSEGEIIYRQGDPADGLYRVRRGDVRIERPGSGGSATVTVSAGDIFGEPGFLTGDVRDASAVAVGDVEVDFLRRNEFLALVARQPALLVPIFSSAFDLADGADPVGDIVAAPPFAASTMVTMPPLSGTDGESAPQIRLIPDSRRARDLLGTDVLEIDSLPFRIGRQPDDGSRGNFDDIDLVLPDNRPYNLSRRHFAIERGTSGLVVRDFNSFHGTTVNGHALGGEDGPKFAVLDAGETEIVAGRPDSPFKFRLIID